MYRLLVVEDDARIAEEIQEQARLWDMDCRTVTDFRNVLEEFARYEPHIVLMDIGLPFFNGYHWCSEIRRISSVPILFISSASDNMNILMAINMGADDFIAKPFDREVLMAKLRSLLRRTYDFGLSPHVLEHRGALLNTDDGALTVNGARVELTKNEFRILLTLMEERGRIVSRERLMERLWKTRQFVDENTLTVNIGRLRRKLEAVGLPGFIATKVGQGYIVE